MSFLTRTAGRSLLAANAIAPRQDHRVFTVPSFFASWFTTELSAPLLAIDALDTALFVRKGGLHTAAGRAAVLARLATAGASAYHWRQATDTHQAFVRGFGNYSHAHEAPELHERHGLPMGPSADRRGDLLPVFHGSKNRRRRRNVTFATVDGTDLCLDIYEPNEPPPAGVTRPCVIYVHGGAWVVGDKREQGVPMLNHLAANGYVGFNVNYRLSPKVKAPDHVIDVKRAIAWVRRHAEEYGADPDFIAISGGSAGGHLAALAALTGEDTSLQPGFEDADCSVQAAVPFYGVYDLTDRVHPDMLAFLDRVVFDRPWAEDPKTHLAYSPIERTGGDPPPFLIIHGAQDVLVPVAGARAFAERVRSASSEPVLYVELEGAQHAFDVFVSPRTRRTLDWVEKFLDSSVLRFREATGDTVAPVAEGQSAAEALAAAG
ncbi:MAG: alpha/beta hydrolase [Microthrixaceae bacterium]